MAQNARSSGILLILIIGLLAAAASFYLSALYFRQDEQRAVMSSLAGNVSSFQTGLRQVGERLDLLTAHLRALETVTPDNFDPMAEALAAREPQAEIITLAQPVAADRYADFLQAARTRYEAHLSGAFPPAESITGTAYRIALLSPTGLADGYLARNAAAGPLLADALSRAEASGNVIAGPGWLTDGAGPAGQWTFFRAVPGKGVLAGLYDVSALARGAFGGRAAGDGLSITLFAQVDGDWQPVYHQGEAAGEANVSQREFSSDIPLYGTRWRVLAEARVAKPLYALWQPWAIAAIPFLMSLIFIAVSPLFKPLPQTAKAAPKGRKRPVSGASAGSGDSSSSSIIGQMVDGIITINTDGIIQIANPAAVKMFGYDDEDELVGRNVAVLMGEPYRSNHDSYIQRYLKSGEARILGQKREVKAQRKSGVEFPMELAVSEVEIEGNRLFTATMRDITDRKRVDMLKSEFISTVSHELRTPLTSIRGSLGIIINSMTEELPEKVSKLLRVAYQNSERLSALVNDILDMERLDADQVDYKFEPVNMNRLAEEAIEANESYANQYDVNLVAHPFHKPLYISGDFDRLMQLMNNLISNACKFSPKGASVNVWFDRVDGSVRMTVQDQGDGIAPEFQAKLFERFTQGDSSDTRTKGGAGLGLYIVKKIVERHGGRISFESHQGRGTKFFVELPLIDHDEQDADEEIPGEDKAAVPPAVEEPAPAGVEEKETGQQGTSEAPAAGEVAEGEEKTAPGSGRTEPRETAEKPGKDEKPEKKKEGKKPPKVEIIKQESVSARKPASGKASEGARSRQLTAREAAIRKKTIKDRERRQAEQEAKARAAASERKKERLRPRILVCEDDPEIAEFVKMVLTGEGFRVEVTHTAQDAFKRATTEHFDALTVDMILPDRDGISLIRALRRSARAADLDIVVISRRAKEGIEKLGAGALGVHAWLQKPLKKDKLREAFHGIEAKAARPDRFVLLLDTSKAAEENLQQLLSGTADVERATSLAEARGLMKEGEFNLIVCDPDTIEDDPDDVVGFAKEAKLPILAYTSADLPDGIRGKFTGIYRKTEDDLETLCEKAFSLLGDSKPAGKSGKKTEPAMTDA